MTADDELVSASDDDLQLVRGPQLGERDLPVNDRRRWTMTC